MKNKELNSRKAITSMTIDKDTLDLARDKHLNVSNICETALRTELKLIKFNKGSDKEMIEHLKAIIREDKMLISELKEKENKENEDSGWVKVT